MIKSSRAAKAEKPNQIAAPHDHVMTTAPGGPSPVINGEIAIEKHSAEGRLNMAGGLYHLKSEGDDLRTVLQCQLGKHEECEFRQWDACLMEEDT